MADEEGEGRRWNADVVPRVLQLLLNFLPHRGLPKLLLLNPSCYRALASHRPLSQVIDLHEMANAGERLIAALWITRYRQVKQINLEFAQEVEDKHLIFLKNQACSCHRHGSHSFRTGMHIPRVLGVYLELLG